MTTENNPYEAPESNLEDSSSVERVEKAKTRIRTIQSRLKILTVIFASVVIYFLVFFFDPSQSPEELDKHIVYYMISGFIMAIAYLIYMFKLAKALDRNKWLWSILSMIFPPWSILISYLIVLWISISEIKKEKTRLELFASYETSE